MNDICPPRLEKCASETQRFFSMTTAGNYKGPAERLMNGDPDSVVWTGGLAESWDCVL